MYRFDECPRCLCQLSKVTEQEDLMLSTARNMEPMWSLSTAQKMSRWSNTLRDQIHSGRTPRHNPTIRVSSPNAKYGTQGAVRMELLGKTKPTKVTPLVSPVSQSTQSTPTRGKIAPPPASDWDGLPQSYNALREEMAHEEAVAARAEAETAKAEASTAKAQAAKALAEVAYLRKLLEGKNIVEVS